MLEFTGVQVMSPQIYDIAGKAKENDDVKKNENYFGEHLEAIKNKKENRRRYSEKIETKNNTGVEQIRS